MLTNAGRSERIHNVDRASRIFFDQISLHQRLNSIIYFSKKLVDRGDDQPSAIAILDVGGMDHGTDQQAGDVGHEMALAPFDLRGGIVTLQPASLGRFDRLAVDDLSRRAGFPALGFPDLWHKAQN
jgi:hypothetical protein